MVIPKKIVLYMMCLLAGSVCFSATIYVDDAAVNDPAPADPNVSDPLEDGSINHPFDAIQEAINIADANDIVLVADGTYTGDGNRDVDFLGKAIAVQSENGPEVCIIDCQGSETDPHRAFNFRSGETHESILEGFTITNGYAPTIPIDGGYEASEGGGGIYCSNSGPVIKKCRFIKNTSITIYRHGSGIRVYSGTGGAIYTKNANMNITYCWFDNNYAYYGGSAIDSTDSVIVISNSIFSGNRLTGGFCYGAYRLRGSISQISNSTFYENNMYALGEQGIIVTGAVHISCGSSELASSNLTLFNSIVWGKRQSGIGVDSNSHLSVSYSNTQAYYSGEGNISIEPNFIQPGYWAGMETNQPEDDVWYSGDYHLKSEGWRWDSIEQQWTWDDVTSPCIDAGNPGMALGDEPVTVDVDPLNRWGENIRVNMGAYGGTDEASMAPPGWALLSDLDNSGDVNLADLTSVAGVWLEAGENMPPDVSRDGVVNLEDMAFFAQDWLKTTGWY